MVQRVYVNQNDNAALYGVRKYRAGQVNRRIAASWKENNPYTSFQNVVSHTGYGNKRFLATDAWFTTGVPVWVTNKARSKFIEALRGEVSEMGTSALEMRKSFGMVAARAIQLRNAYLALRNFDLPRVGKELMMSPADSKKSGTRAYRELKRDSPTSAWLEYWMGWAPMLNDMYNAIDVLQRPPPDRMVSGGSSFRLDDLVTKVGQYPKPGQWYEKRGIAFGRYAYYGKVRLVNQNLWLANQLGLVNPALTAWQFAPFSWLVDWFTNVGQMLDAMTDTVGCSLTDTGAGLFISSEIKQVGADYGPLGPSGGLQSYFTHGVGQYRQRIPGGIPTPRLTFGFPKLSLTRAATAVSLLTEIFLRK